MNVCVLFDFVLFLLLTKIIYLRKIAKLALACCSLAPLRRRTAPLASF